MRKTLSLTIPLLIIIGMLFVYFFFASPSPSWVGLGQNGKWMAKLYKTQEGSSLVYDGNFYWMGSKTERQDVSITLTQYRVNGEYITGDKKEHQKVKITEHKPLSFVGMTSKPDMNDDLEAVIYWYKMGTNMKTPFI